MLRHCAFGFVLVLGACQRQEPEQSADKKVPLANTELDESKRQFEADVEKSKQNAVLRFPELGVAGSEMNKAFVARVTHLRALNSPEFNYSTWPYQLACQVDYEVKQEKEKTQKEKSSALNQKERLEKEAKQEARFGKTNHRDFTVEELLQEKTIPNVEITLIGHVTKLETSVGNNGTFYYPKLDLVATAMILKDVTNLGKANQEERDAIFKLRENLNIVRKEELRKKELEIHYELQIPKLDQWSLKDNIANATMNFLQTQIDESKLNIV